MTIVSSGLYTVIDIIFQFLHDFFLRNEIAPRRAQSPVHRLPARKFDAIKSGYQDNGNYIC